MYRGHQVKISGSKVQTYASLDNGDPPLDASWAIGDGVLKRYQDCIFFEVKITANNKLKGKNNFAIGVSSTKTVVVDDAPSLVNAFGRVCYFRFDGTFVNTNTSKEPITLGSWTPPVLHNGDRVCIAIDSTSNLMTLYVNSHKEVTAPTPFPGYNLFPVLELLGTVESAQLLIGESPPTIRCTRWNSDLCGQRCQISSDGKTATFSSLAVGTAEEKMTGGTVFGDAPLAVIDKKLNYAVKIKRVQQNPTEGFWLGITQSRPSLLESVPPTVTKTPKSYLVGGKDGKIILNGVKDTCTLDFTELKKGDKVQVITTQHGVLCVFWNGSMKILTHTKIKDFSQVYACAGIHGRASSIEIDTTSPIPQLFMRGWHSKYKSPNARISYQTTASFKGEFDGPQTGVVIGDLPCGMHDGRIWFEFKIIEDSDTNYNVLDFIFGLTTAHPEELEGYGFVNILEIPEFYGIRADGTYFHDKEEPVQLNWSKNSFVAGDEIGLLISYESKNTMQLFVNGVEEKFPKEIFG
jgi:hypothetical protein